MIPQKHLLHIPGHDPGSGSFAALRSPFNGAVLAQVEQADSNAMELAIATARSAYDDVGGRLPAWRRSQILRRLAGLMEEQADSLALCIAQEGGKPLKDAIVETTRAIGTVGLCAEEATRYHGQQVPMDGSAAGAGRLAFTIREPIGVVAAISAFNHPLNLIAHQVAPAVAAGCPVLIKPSPETVISAMRFTELLAEAGLPPAWCMAVPCDNAVAEQLATSDQIGFFSFIGSASVGWHLRSKLAPGVRCTLEHGGAAPAIIDQGADLERAVPALIKGGYYHAGQVCVSVQRIFAHDSVADQLVAALLEGVRGLHVGDPSDAQTDVGPLIRAGEVDRVHKWVQKSVAEGATLAAGGQRLDQQCYAPTLLLDAPAHTPIMTSEIFGPVMVVNRFTDLDDAIASANDVPWSFQAAWFGRDLDRAMHAAQRLKGAAVMLNDHTAFRVDWMPFAARGPSGLGVGGVGPAVHDLTEEKLIVIKPGSIQMAGGV